MNKTGTGQAHIVSWGCGNSEWRTVSQISYRWAATNSNCLRNQAGGNGLSGDRSYQRIGFSLRLLHCLPQLRGGLKSAAQGYSHTLTKKMSID